MDDLKYTSPTVTDTHTHIVFYKNCKRSKRLGNTISAKSNE